jgi:hypothetical protein
MQSEGRRLVSIPDTRRVLGGIGQTMVYELIKQGEIVKVNIGSRGFVTSESLDAYLDRLSGSVAESDTDEGHDLLGPGAEGEVL